MIHRVLLAFLAFMAACLLTAPDPIRAQSATELPPAPPEPFLTDLGFVTDFAFASNGHLLTINSFSKKVCEYTSEGTSLSCVTTPVAPQGKLGQMLGIAPHPDFPINRIVYVHYLDTQRWANVIVRFRWTEDGASDVQEILLLPLPADQEEPCTDHNGGHFGFGPDGALYVPMGENCFPELAQDLTTFQGSVLRVNPRTGEALPDNPFYDGDGPNDDRLWAKGLRNPFGSTFDPITGKFWVTDNGPGCGDEVNLVEAGSNYGWPVSSDSYFECHDPGPPYIPPVWEWTPPIAPTGITAYTGEAIPQWRDSLFMCDWNTQRLHRLQLTPNRDGVVADIIIDIGDASCPLDVEMSPDGQLYFGGFDAIYRIQIQPLYGTPQWLPLLLISN
ncbi:MAG TPA: hypothetical protein ENK60_08680 [Anaerolineae bacterium]|nr:hypothetical protein [Anaerolineae bacterium]